MREMVALRPVALARVALLLALAVPTAEAQVASAAPQSAARESQPLSQRRQLTGDWGGARTRLAAHGVTVDLSTTGFYVGLLDGSGEEELDFGSRFDALIRFDTGKLGLWQGGGLETHLEANDGNAPLSVGGAFLPTNTGAGLPLGQPSKVVASSLYVTQQLSGAASLLAGKINVVDLLAADPFYGGWGNTRFLHVAFVAPPSGVLPPTIMGAIVNYRHEPLLWTFMVYDPHDRTGDYSVGDLFADGVNLSAATTWNGTWAGRASNVNLNGIYSTKDGTDLGDFLLPPELKTHTKSGSWHFAVKVSHLLVESAATPGKGLGLYGKAGVSDGNPNPLQALFSGGISGHGLVPGRPRDVSGVGYFYYDLSDDLQDATAAVTNIDDEQGVELFYNLAIAPWFRLTGDLQWVDPANGDNEPAWIGGLRLSVTF